MRGIECKEIRTSVMSNSMLSTITSKDTLLNYLNDLCLNSDMRMSEATAWLHSSSQIVQNTSVQ